MNATKIKQSIPHQISTKNDALFGPRVNPLEGSPNVKLRKLGPKGTLPTSNSRKG
jgi:hypothetical protein